MANSTSLSNTNVTVTASTQPTEEWLVHLPIFLGQPRLALESVSQIGGRIATVAVEGHFAYVGNGPRLIIFDITDPSQPILVGQASPEQGTITTIAVQGSNVYVGSGHRLCILDVSTPASPIQTGCAQLANAVMDVAIADNYAYVAITSAGLHIIDVSTPDAPIEVGAYTQYVSTGFIGVAVAGNHAYYADGDAGLRVIDVSQPSAPIEVGYYDPPDAFGFVAYDVVAAGNYAYIVGKEVGWDGPLGFFVFDVSTPGNLVRLDFMPLPDYPHNVAMAGSQLYVASGSQLQIIDATTPMTPTLLGVYESTSWASSVAITGSVAYVAAYGSLQTVDVTLPASPTLMSSAYRALGAIQSVAVQSPHAYVCADGGLHTLDISAPDSPALIDVQAPFGCDRDIAVAGNYVYAITYVSDFISGLRIVDVSTPGAPVETGFYTMTQRADHVAVTGQFAYVLGQDLSIIDVSDPSHPVLVGAYHILGGEAGLSMVVSEHYIYVGASDYNSGQLMVFDISAPATPQLLKTISVPSWINGLTKTVNYLLAADKSGHLTVFDVSDPGTPVELGTASDSATFNGVAFANSCAFAVGSPGVSSFNVGVPTQPSLTAHYELPADAWKVTTADNDIFVADGEGGLFILRLSPISTFP